MIPLVNMNKLPPSGHSGYCVIKDRKIIGPIYKYYLTALNNSAEIEIFFLSFSIPIHDIMTYISS